MKKFSLILYVLAFAMLFTLFGCQMGGGNNSGSSSSSSFESVDNSSSLDPSISVEEVKYYSAVKDCMSASNGSTIALDGEDYSVKSNATFRFSGLEVLGDTQDLSKAFVFYLKDKENVVIDGNGSSLTLPGDVSLIYLENCKNVTVKNLSVEFGDGAGEEKSTGSFIGGSSQITFENVKFVNCARGIHVQSSQGLSLDGVEYDGKNGGELIFTADASGNIEVKNSKVTKASAILNQYASEDFNGSLNVIVIGSEFSSLENGLNLNASCAVEMSGSIFDGVSGAVIKNAGAFSLKDKEIALSFSGNNVKNSAGKVIDLALEKAEDGGYEVSKIIVENNEFSALSDDYVIDIGEIARMIYNNNVSDKEFEIVKGVNTRVDDGSYSSKVALAIGDSITYGAILDDSGNWTTVENTYFDIVCDTLGITQKKNYGISGTCITYDTVRTPLYDDSLVRRAGILQGGDLIFIAMGTNDFGCFVPLGNEGDRVETTLWGATDLSFETIKKNNPSADVYVILPIKRGDCVINQIGKNLEDYTHVIRKTAHKYGFNTIEGQNFIIDPFDSVHKENYFKPGDVVHPNQAAHYYYAQMVLDGMENRSTTPVAFKEIVGSVMVGDTLEVETVLQNPDAKLTWQSLNENVATVTDGVITGVSGGKTTIIAKDENGNMAVLVLKVTPRASNSDVYLALSKTIGDETTSVLYPYRCDYVYAPSSSFFGEDNAVKFNITIKRADGYLFIVDGTNNDVSTAWGGEAGYVYGAAIGKDYCGGFTNYSGGSKVEFANDSMLKIKDLSTNADLTGEYINWEVGKTYEITYRLAKGHALSFFYTKSVYDTNGSAICWGRWNNNQYCYDVLDSLTFSNFTSCKMEGDVMTARVETFMIEGHQATVLIPANANGKWLWKTEYFYAFDAVELALYDQGYTRAYFEISYKYGSPDAVRLMYKFYQEMMDRFELDEKAYMLGFSIGAMYAFNFTLAHPECVEKVHLDAPVLDLRSWPRTEPQYNELSLHQQVLTEYGFKSEEEFLNYGSYPVIKLQEFFALNIPTLLVAGDSDKTVEFTENSAVMIDYCKMNGVDLAYYVKMGADHHPHAFGRNSTYDFAYPATFKVYSSEIAGSSSASPVTLDNEVSVITWFYE